MNKQKFTHEEIKMIAGMVGIVGAIVTMIINQGICL